MPIAKILHGDKVYTDLSKPIENDNNAEGVRGVMQNIPEDVWREIRRVKDGCIVFRVLPAGTFQITGENLNANIIATVRAHLHG